MSPFFGIGGLLDFDSGEVLLSSLTLWPEVPWLGELIVTDIELRLLGEAVVDKIMFCLGATGFGTESAV